MWFKYYKGYYDVRKLELELVSWRERDFCFLGGSNDGSLRNFRRESVGIEISFEQILWVRLRRVEEERGSRKTLVCVVTRLKFHADFQLLNAAVPLPRFIEIVFSNSSSGNYCAATAPRLCISSRLPRPAFPITRRGGDTRQATRQWRDWRRRALSVFQPSVKPSTV